MDNKKINNVKKPWWKTIFRKDANIFVKIGRTLLLTATVWYAGQTTILYSGIERNVTNGEEKLLQKMGYKSSIDTKKIRIRKSKLGDKYLDFLGFEAITSGNDILVRSEQYSDDYSKEKGTKEHIFKHEIGHAWQYQQCTSYIGFERTIEFFNAISNGGSQVDLYMLNIQGGAKNYLLGYSIEQQAELLAELDKKGDKNYQAIMKNFLKDPLYAKNKCLPWN